MRNLFTIARTDLSIYLSDRGNLISLVAMPLILTLLLGGVFGGDGPAQIRLDVIDHDASPQSAQLVNDLRAVNPALIICPQDQNDDDACRMGEVESLDEAAALGRARAGSSSGVLVIPAGYAAALANFEPAQLRYYSSATMPGNDPVSQSLQAVLQRVNGAVVAAQVGSGLADVLEIDGALNSAAYEQARAMWDQPPVRVTYAETTSNTRGNTSGFNQSVPGMATFFVVFSVLGAGMYGLVKERTQGTLPRMATMPVSRAAIIGGKILTYFILGMIQFGVVFLIGLLVRIDFGRDMLALLLVMVAYTLCITALGFALAPRMRNENQISALTTLLGMTMGALGGAWWPLDIAPDFMQIVGHLTPVAWAMDAFRQLFFFGGGLPDVLLPVGVLLAAALLLFGIGIRAFKFN